MSKPTSAGVWSLERTRNDVPQNARPTNSGVFASEAAAMTKASIMARHTRQLRTLARTAFPLPGRHPTKWGLAQPATSYGDGIVRYDTAGHGGLKLDRNANAAMPASLRLADGWYEPYCEWARVAMGHPSRFTDLELADAEKVLKNLAPDTWEAFTGKEIPLEESHVKRQRAFEESTRDKLVVISAVRSDHHPGMAEVIATVGGDHGDTPKRRFLVPAEEYASRELFGFVIDEEQHEEMIPHAPSP